MLCLYEAKKRAGVTGKVICVGSRDETIARTRKANLADYYIKADATNAVDLMNKVKEITNGEMADIVINTVNIPNTEMSSILLTKDQGIVYFFSMATSFTKAALGAEGGVGKDITMIIGNGYTKDHAAISLELMRESQELRNIFEELYA